MKKLLLTLMFVAFLNSNAQNPVQEFTFNGTLSSTDNSITLLGAPNFVNDRMGTAKAAQRITNKVLQGVVGELPQENKPRSISFWVKFNNVASANYILGYGTAVNTQFFGLLQQPVASGNSDLSLVGWGDANNVVVSTPLQKEVWYQYNITYDGNTSKIYRNGELLKSATGISRATKGYILRLGQLNTTTVLNADIDDLKIYNVAMTDEQVMDSFTSSKPAAAPVSNTIKKVAVAPPTKAVVPVKTPVSAAESATENNGDSKTIEVFSQGKKITGSNASNITDLPEGTYLLKITKTPAKK
ncbi:LamG domain-containing protein [Flavobacterium sp. 245]|uniref:LamG domain-containing protein n=1 Tax=Flavobacterium sp. 245 TaxID=2512115 RepID=UPI0010602D9E|nr:LamG domain-containing protein [Flavobacterium sp. 245]TDP01295.1 concanavalin A-like lectin/glucanase superfamily protein [Flavobacterium sp. 245]